jgi:hypothetical protein
MSSRITIRAAVRGESEAAASPVSVTDSSLATCGSDVASSSSPSAWPDI